MSDEAATLEIKGLQQILKALKARPPIARIGILGGGKRQDGVTDNATIGAAHEFGTTKMAKRSFLREPLNDRLNKEIEKSHLLDDDTMKEVIKSGSVLPWVKEIAVMAEGIVLGAFDSNGYGKWAAWKREGYSSMTGQILVDTQQLRNSITTEVKA